MKKLAIILTSLLVSACASVSTPSSSSSPPPATTSPSTQNPESRIQNSIQIALVDPIGEPGSGTFGCGDRIVMVNRSVSTTTPLQTAIEELLSIRTSNYGQSGFITALSDQDLRVTRVTIADGIATIELAGNIRFGGACDIPRVQEQIKRTIQQFSSIRDYRILLNGSDRNWVCLFDSSGDC